MIVFFFCVWVYRNGSKQPIFKAPVLCISVSSERHIGNCVTSFGFHVTADGRTLGILSDL